MKKILLATSAVALLASFSSAQAAPYQNQTWPKWYVGVSGSVGFLDDTDFSGGSTGNSDFDEGYGVGGQIGYMTGWYGIRAELEYYYRRNSADSVTLGGVTGTSDGHVSSNAFMANAYYDFRNSTGFTPYVGGGIGWAHVSGSNITNGTTTVDGGDDSFAWQLMAGISYEPVSIPMTVWSLGYRYFTVDDVSFGGTDADYDTHNIEANVKFRF